MNGVDFLKTLIIFAQVENLRAIRVYAESYSCSVFCYFAAEFLSLFFSPLIFCCVFFCIFLQCCTRILFSVMLICRLLHPRHFKSLCCTPYADESQRNLLFFYFSAFLHYAAGRYFIFTRTRYSVDASYQFRCAPPSCFSVFFILVYVPSATSTVDCVDIHSYSAGIKLF